MTASHRYVLSTGSYDDYRVLCIVDGTEADAEQLARRYNEHSAQTGWYASAQVETLDVASTKTVPVSVANFQVNIWDDGRQTDLRETIVSRWPFDLLWPQWEAHPFYWRWVRAPIHEGCGGRLEVYGQDIEQCKHSFALLRANPDAFRNSSERTNRKLPFPSPTS